MSTIGAPPLFHLEQGRFGSDAVANGVPGTAAEALTAPIVAPIVADVANLSGDYTYLTSGYYVSLDAELAGLKVLPTTADALDAYVVPIAMLKASQAGIPVPEHLIVTDRFPPPPMLAYPINPFSSKGELILDQETLESRRKGLTYTGKYAVLVQLLPSDQRIDVVRLVMGKATVPEYQAFGEKLFELFRLPLMRVRVIVTPREYLLSAIEPLPFGELTDEERAQLEGLGRWRA